jgi:hypothetical protein
LLSIHRRWALALALALCALVASRRAQAWQEAHETGDDVEIRLDPDGAASIRNILHWHVVRGPLRWIELENVDPSAILDPNVLVRSEDGRSLTAHLVRRKETSVRVEVDDPRSFMRGTFAFDVRWRVDWARSAALARDGMGLRLSWSSPLAATGFDSARATLDLPAAPAAPVAIVADTGAVDDSAIAMLQRGPARDVLELVRPHVARGESVAWTVRIDPRVLPAVVDPRLRQAAAVRAPEPDRVRDVSLVAVVSAFALAYGLLVAHKARAFATACRERGLRARALVPLPDGMRAALAGLGLAGGAWLQATDRPTIGSALVAAAVLAAALRGPRAPLSVRGPGRWLVLRPMDAFAAPSGHGHWLDTSSRAGRVTAWIAGGVLFGVAVALRRIDAEAPWLVAIDAAALVPLLITGRACDLPPDGARSAGPWLASVFRRLRAVESLRVAPWARVVFGRSTFDELRLLVLPRPAMPGLVGVEVGRAFSLTSAGWAATPEVLVRVLEESAAAVKLAHVLPRARALPGRRPDERVVRLAPRSGTRASTIALMLGLAEALTDRRVAFPPGRCAGRDRDPERRADRSVRGRSPPGHSRVAPGTTFDGAPVS